MDSQTRSISEQHLFRFYNTQTGHHFFTASQDEANYVKAKVISDRWPFNYEGVAFNVYANDPTSNSQGSEIAVHRFYSPSLNRHFYTANQTEVDEIKLTGKWNYEGIGFWGGNHPNFELHPRLTTIWRLDL